MIGKTLANRYQIEEKIGDGGMAVVYKGCDILLNRFVAVKVLRAQFALDENFVSLFRREAQSAASLSHPNIVNIYDVGEEDDTHYIVMEYIDGKSLKQLINEKKGGLPLNQAVDIARQICEGLIHAHKNNIIHRDIKPHNILITRDGRVKVTDFGIARAVTAATLTYNNNVIMGSVHYFAPEQAKGGLVGVKADLYSLGIVLYEMLTGEVPFSGDSPISIVLKHLQENIKSPMEINADIPPALEKIVLKAVQKDVSLRYQNAEEMLADLSNWKVKGFVNSGSFRKPVVNSVKVENNPVRNRDKKTKRKAFNWRYGWLAAGFLAFFLFVFVLAAGFGQLKSFWMVPEVEVPEVTDLPISEAKIKLEEFGLEFEIIEESPHDEVPAGYVIFQNPEAGRTVKQGREIKLVMSTGPSLVSVPSVVNKTELEAKIELKEHNLIPRVTEEYSPTVPAGKVISQDPGYNSQLTKGEIVNIVVSKGSEAFSLRSFAGYSLEDAEEWLDLSNLNLGKVEKEFSDEPEGQVIRQYPEAGQMVQAFDYVDLVVSKGPDPAKQESCKINIDPGLWGVDNGEKIRLDISDDKGSRTAFEGPYVGVPIIVEGWGSGTVAIMKEDGQGYRTLDIKAFPP